MDALTASQRSIIRKLRDDCKCEDLSVDPDKTFAAMDKRYSLSSTRVVLTALRKLYPENKSFIAKMKERYTTFQKIDKTQTPTEKQEDAHIAWDSIIKWRDASAGELPIQDRLLVGLYTYIEPQRLDYTPMRVVVRLPKALEEGINYLVMGKRSARFVFHAYKTAGTYGDRVFNAPAALYRLLEEYLGERRSGYLFQDAAIAWTPARLGSNIRRIFLAAFGKEVSANALRHSYLTKAYTGMPSLAALESISKAMGHDILTSQKYRYITLEH